MEMKKHVHALPRDLGKKIIFAYVQGRAEAHAETTRAIARNMKGLGIPMEQIIKVTGLSEHEISAL